MPAIQLARLNDEIEFLAKRFDRPDEFHHELKELFERYANWSFRPGEHIPKSTQAPQYYVAPVIPQKLLLALRPRSEKAPQQGLELASRLWQDTYFEIRQLAISLLSIQPVQPLDAFIEQIQKWAQPGDDPFILSMLFEEGCRNLRRSSPQPWLLMIENWLSSNAPEEQMIGLRALLASVNDLSFPHLPNLFKLATEPLRTSMPGMMALMQNLVEALIRRSPAETSFFFRQILLRGASHETIRIIRRNLGLFQKEQQLSIRSALTDLKSNNPYKSGL